MYRSRTLLGASCCASTHPRVEISSFPPLHGILIALSQHNSEQDRLLPSHARSRFRSSLVTASGRPLQSTIVVRQRWRHLVSRAREDVSIPMKASQLSLLPQDMHAAKHVFQPSQRTSRYLERRWRPRIVGIVGTSPSPPSSTPSHRLP